MTNLETGLLAYSILISIWGFKTWVCSVYPAEHNRLKDMYRKLKDENSGLSSKLTSLQINDREYQHQLDKCDYLKKLTAQYIRTIEDEGLV